MPLELRALRYFVAVAEARHITRAARQLGMAQPPLSQQIKALEQHLGAALFRRLPRGVELTPAGEALLDDARALIQQAEQAEVRVRRVARGELGRLRLARRMDAAFIRPLLAPEEGLVETPLMSEDLVIALPSGHPLSRRRRLPLMALSLEPFVLFPRAVGAGLHEEILRACHRVGFLPRVVQAGMGVSIVPASMQQAQIDGVSYRAIAGAVPKARLSLIHRADEADTAQIQNLLQLV